MRASAWIVALGLFATPVTAQTAPSGEACTRAHSTEALETGIDPQGVNATLLDQAMRMEVNLARCVEGLSPVEQSWDLAKGATLLAFSTARPELSIASSETMKGDNAQERAAAAGFTRVGVENTGWFPWLDLSGGGQARDWTLGPCGYRDAQGQPVGVFTYARFAQEVVGVMMRGGESAANLLRPDVVGMGVGAAYTTQGPTCGTIFVVQTLGG